MLYVNIVALKDVTLSTGVETLELEAGTVRNVQFESRNQAKSFEDTGVLAIVENETDAQTVLTDLYNAQAHKLRNLGKICKNIKEVDIFELEKYQQSVNDITKGNKISEINEVDDTINLTEVLTIPEDSISLSDFDDDYTNLPLIEADKNADETEGEDDVVEVVGTFSARKKYKCKICRNKNMVEDSRNTTHVIMTCPECRSAYALAF